MDHSVDHPVMPKQNPMSFAQKGTKTRMIRPVGIPSDMESKYYYHGLPSRPRLVARSSTTPWEVVTGPWTFPVPKELRPIGNHRGLRRAWQSLLPTQLFQAFDELHVNWTSLDVLRMASVRDGYTAGADATTGDDEAHAILWVGVMPVSLTPEDGYMAAMRVQHLLRDFGIFDVECEIRETRVLRSVGPKLLKPLITYDDPTRDVRISLTTTLGQPIATLARPWAEGTLGFFAQAGGDRSKLFFVTAGHVVTRQGEQNTVYHRTTTTQPAQKVILLGRESYGKLLAKIRNEVDDMTMLIEDRETTAKRFEGDESDEAKEHRIKNETWFDDSRKTREAFRNLEKEVATKWDNPENRVMGFKLLSPPLVAGAPPLGFTQDWAMIQLDLEKIDATNFVGNVIDLGTAFSRGQLTRMMNPHPRNPPGFKFPAGGLLRIRGKISLDEMRHPTLLDGNGEPGIVVVKRGRTTGLTIGRATELESFSRIVFEGVPPHISKEWAILPYDKKSGPFSDGGDSGAAIVDGHGRLGGIVTGGTSYSSSLDVTYAPPIDGLLDSFRQWGFDNVNLSPELPA